MLEKSNTQSNCIGKRIQQWRIQERKTIEQLATEAGVGIQTIKQLECGKTDCYLSTVLNIATALGVSLDYLVGTERADSSKNLMAILDSLTLENRKTVAKFLCLMQASEKFELSDSIYREE